MSGASQRKPGRGVRLLVVHHIRAAVYKFVGWWGRTSEVWVSWISCLDQLLDQLFETAFEPNRLRTNRSAVYRRTEGDISATAGRSAAKARDMFLDAHIQQSE